MKLVVLLTHRLFQLFCNLITSNSQLECMMLRNLAWVKSPYKMQGRSMDFKVQGIKHLLKCIQILHRNLPLRN